MRQHNNRQTLSPNLKPLTQQGLSFYKNTPDELRQCKQWLLWRAEPGKSDKKPDKIPYRLSRTGEAVKADPTNPNHYLTFDEAMQILAHHPGVFSGLAFAFTEHDPFVFVDLDTCVMDTGEINKQAQHWIQHFHSFTERSQSGRGFHIISRGKKPGDRCKNAKLDIEIYEKDRYVAFTGNVCQGFDTITDAQNAINTFYAWAFGKEPPRKTSDTQKTSTYALTDSAILTKLNTAKNSQKFHDLYAGEWEKCNEYGSQSEADFALCELLVFYSQDLVQIDRLFRKSGLMREKWDSRRGDITYGEQTIQRALEACQEHYAEKPKTKSLPTWAFWTYEVTRFSVNVKVSASKYIDFLTNRGFRVFMKRGEPVIVYETEESMENTIVRGRINASVKQFVIETLQNEGFLDVVDFMLLNSKYFTIDVLEMLPEVDRQKARHSIFSEPETTITLETPLVNEQPIIAYDDTPLLCRGTTLGIVGKQGIGKSGICELFASLTVNPNCEEYCPFTVTTNGGITIWVDTERTQNELVWALRRIKQRTQAEDSPAILTQDNTAFQTLRVERCTAIDDKMTWLLELLETIEIPIDLLIIDGALDMVESMNDEIEAKHFYTDILRIANTLDCGVMLTIHSGANDETGRAMGHVGGIIMRKCGAFLQIRNSEADRTIKELSTDFKHVKMRSGRHWGIYAALQWDEDDNMLHFIDYTPPDVPKHESLRKKVAKNMELVFSESPKLTWGG